MSMSNGSQLSILMLHPKTLVDSWPFPVDTLGESGEGAKRRLSRSSRPPIRNLPLRIEIFDGYVDA